MIRRTGAVAKHRDAPLFELRPRPDRRVNLTHERTGRGRFAIRPEANLRVCEVTLSERDTCASDAAVDRSPHATAATRTDAEHGITTAAPCPAPPAEVSFERELR